MHIRPRKLTVLIDDDDDGDGDGEEEDDNDKESKKKQNMLRRLALVRLQKQHLK